MDKHIEQKNENMVGVIEVKEKKELPLILETVRAAIFYRGKFLILQKTVDSKNPGGLEFPGGKIDNIKGESSTPEEQELTVLEEVQQETGIEVDKMPIEKIEDFKTYFETKNKDGVKNKHKRLVHLFLINIPDTQEISLRVNETKNKKGESEDKHKSYIWVSPGELIDSATKLKENTDTGKKTYPLTRNSRHIKELLLKIGALKYGPKEVIKEVLMSQEDR